MNPRIRRSKVLSLAVLLLAVAAPARADFTYQISIDSSTVPSGTSGSIYFQFNPGGATYQTATALVTGLQETDISFNGGSTIGDASTTGPFPSGGSLAMDNAQLTNGLLEGVSFGVKSSLSFDVTFGGAAVNAPDGNPNDAATSFFFGVLDSNFAPLLPFGNGVDPLVEIDLLPSTGGFAVTDTPPVALVTPATVPEPGSLTLMALGLATIVAIFGARPARAWLIARVTSS